MLALRAWNSANEEREPDPFVVVAIVIANLFGFLHNIGLPETANALAKKLTDWSSEKSESFEIDELDGGKISPPSRFLVELVLKTSTQEKTVIELWSLFKWLIKGLLRSEDTKDAFYRISELDFELSFDDFPRRNMKSEGGVISVLPYGVTIQTYSSAE